MENILESIVKKCQQASVELSADGDDLKVSFDEYPPETLINLIKEHKQALLAFLSSKAEQSNNMEMNELATSISDNPVSFGQRRLWLLDKIHSGSAAYNNVSAFKLKGELNTDAAEKAFRFIIQRHDILHSVIEECQGEPKLSKRDDILFKLQSMDLTDLSNLEQETRLQEIIKEEQRHVFDSSVDVLLRAVWIKRGNEQDTLLVNLHHLAGDGWSTPLLIKDWSTAYLSLCNGEEPNLAPLKRQYGDYARLQHQWMSSHQCRQQTEYWLQKLTNIDPMHRIPLDMQRNTTVKDTPADTVKFEIDTAEYQQLLDVAKAYNVSLFMLIHAVYSLLVGHYSNHNDVMIGTPTANRNDPAFANLIGFFANTVVLRTDTGQGVSFSDYLAQVKRVVEEANSHQELPFDRLVEELNVPRSGSAMPLIQLMLLVEKAKDESYQLGNLSLSPLDIEDMFALFDLTLRVTEKSNSMSVELIFDQSLFAPQTIDAMASNLAAYFNQIAVNPNIEIGKLRLSESELKVLQQDVNNTTVEYQTEQLVHHLIEQQATYTPEQVALYAQQRNMTFVELNQRANMLAHQLIEKGLSVGQVVAVASTRSHSLLVGILAVLKAGGTYLPLDPTYPIQRLDHMLADSRAEWLLAETKVLPLLDHRQYSHTLTLDDYVNDELVHNSHRLSNPDLDSTLMKRAYIMYTSGSTGLPKGVQVSHYNLLNIFAGLEQLFPKNQAEQDIWLSVTSISFDISILELLWTLSKGDRVILQPEIPSRVEDERGVDMSLFYFAAKSPCHTDKYQLLLQGAKLAEQEGLSGVWVPERHFSEFGDQYPNPAVAAAAVAAITNNIKIRAGSVVLPLHDTIRVAEEWSMVDNLSAGRVEVSIASGWHPNDFVLAPDRYTERHRHMREQLTELQSLWQGQTLHRTNGNGQAIDVQLHPAPIQSDLPIWVTAAGHPDTFRYAGTIGANLLTHMLGQTSEGLAENIRIYREALQENGYASKSRKVALMLHTFISDEEDIRTIVEQPFKEYLKQSVNLLLPLAKEQALDIDKDMDMVLNIAFERYYHSSGLFGSVSECLQKTRQFQALGVDEVACLIDFGVNSETVMRNLPNIAIVQRLSKQAAAQQRLLTACNNAFIAPSTLIMQQKVTHMQCTPTYAANLMQQEEGKIAVGRLQALLVGGEILPSGLVEKLLAVCQGQIFNMYGPTETTIWSAISRVDSTTVVIGRPMANTRFYILNSSGELLPRGAIGELHIAGDGVTIGYLNRPELTADRFVPEWGASNCEQRMYRTGDLVRMCEDGSLTFFGRNDNQVKINGVRIELEEIESHILREPGIDLAVVAAGRTPDGQQRLLAFAKFHDKYNRPATEELILQKEHAIFQRLQRHLPAHMLPVKIKLLESIPLTPNGKIDRQRLPIDDYLSMEQFVAPSTADEIKMADIWSELLNIDVGRVSLYDNFFNLGGQSLSLISLRGRIQSSFGVDVGLDDLFSNAQLDHMVSMVETRQSSTEQTSIPECGKNIAPASYFQQGIWVAEQISEQRNTFYMSHALRLHGPLSISALEQTFKEIAKRHQTLNTNFFVQDGLLMQRLSEASKVTIKVRDISGINVAEQDSKVREILSENARKIIDLSEGKLWHVSVAKEGDESHVLFFDVHHLIFDGWSKRILLNEIKAIYQSIVNREAFSLADMPLQYIDFAYWHRDQYQSGAFNNQLDFWRKQLTNVPTPTNLPRDYSYSEQRASNDLGYGIHLDKELANEVRQFANAHNLSVFMVLLGIYNLVLHAETDSDDIIVGTDVANRGHQGLDQVIGFFVNQLTLRNQINSGDSITNFFQSLRQNTIEAFANQDIPFDQLVKELNVFRDLQYTPLFQSKFWMDHMPKSDNTWQGLAIEEISFVDQVARSELTLGFVDTDEEIHGGFIYSAALFKESTIARMSDSFNLALKAICADPRQSVRELTDKLEKPEAKEDSKKSELSAKFAKFNKKRPARKSLMD